MAYTASPEKQTYSSKRIAMTVGCDPKPGAFNQNPGMKNILPFKHDDQEFGETRLPIYVMDNITVGGTETVRGMFVWEKTSSETYKFVVVGTKVYSSNGGSFAQVNTLTDTSENPVRFAEFIDSTGTKKLVLVDGTGGIVYTTNAAGTAIVDADFPTPHIPFPIFLDGYLFLAKADTGDIYNSDLDDPSAWTAGNFISSEVYPDDIKALVKVQNYILAIGKQGSEFFYDAANATGSPLARVDGGILPFGTALANSIAANKDTVTFFANRNEGSGTLVTVEGLKFKEHGDNPIIQKLTISLLQGTSVTPTLLRSSYIRQRGVLFYCIQFIGKTGYTSTEAPCYVYSFDTNKWTEFVYGSDGTSQYPVYFNSPSLYSMTTWVVGKTTATNAFFGKLRNFVNDSGVPVDAVDNINVPIYQEIRTPILNFDTLNTKFMNRLGVVVEAQSSAYSSGSASLSIYTSDDNYGTWSSQRTIPLTTTGGYADFPFLTQLGKFRQRAIKLATSGYGMRFHFFEVDINKGQQ